MCIVSCRVASYTLVRSSVFYNVITWDFYFLVSFLLAFVHHRPSFRFDEKKRENIHVYHIIHDVCASFTLGLSFFISHYVWALAMKCAVCTVHLCIVPISVIHICIISLHVASSNFSSLFIFFFFSHCTNVDTYTWIYHMCKCMYV